MIHNLPITPIGISKYVRQGNYQEVLREASHRIAKRIAAEGRTVELFTGRRIKPDINVFGAVPFGEPVPSEVGSVKLRIQIPINYSEESIFWLLAGELDERELLNYWPDAMSLTDVIIDCLPLLPKHTDELVRELGKGCNLRTRQALARALLTIHKRYPDRPEFQAIGLYGDGTVIIPEHYNISYLRRVILQN